MDQFEFPTPCVANKGIQTDPLPVRINLPFFASWDLRYLAEALFGTGDQAEL